MTPTPSGDICVLSDTMNLGVKTQEYLARDKEAEARHNDEFCQESRGEKVVELTSKIPDDYMGDNPSYRVFVKCQTPAKQKHKA